MVAFGYRYPELMQPEWAYVDYKGLKQHIKLIVKHIDAKNTKQART